MDRWLKEWTDEVMRSWKQKGVGNHSTALKEVVE